MKRLTHLDSEGSARMVDVGRKRVTRRVARASALVEVAPETKQAILKGNLPKGDVFNTARVAGILAAKRVHELIPLTHALPVDSVQICFDVEPGGLRIRTEASVRGRTGVEMEAITAAAVSALTVYDMVKAVDRGVVISELRLDYKSGGKTGTWRRGKEA